MPGRVNVQYDENGAVVRRPRIAAASVPNHDLAALRRRRRDGNYAASSVCGLPLESVPVQVHRNGKGLLRW